ncbi:MAG: helix-turn-helix domain-containing protein [Lachnospiraceae bacterium]|nr:helix-turn-helix domain-containing protein [Lachnospiraceae bacterium]
MNELFLSNIAMPIVSSCDYLAASEPFFHADRITDFHVMIYVTDGCIHVTEGDTDYALSPGSLFFLKSGIRHYGRTEIARGTRWHYVHFYVDSISDKIKKKVFSETRPLPLQVTLPKLLTDLTDSELERQILSFTEYFHSTEPQHKWNINQQFFTLLTEIASHDKGEGLPLNLTDRIAQYLTVHYEQPFSAAVLEHKFFLSYKHMAAVFKKEKQLTMQQYHTRVRMNIACKLLRSTLLPIGEISLKVGYSDMLYFSRCFHAHMGMSPTEYRRQPHTY